jgi:hypothetical protein
VKTEASSTAYHTWSPSCNAIAAEGGFVQQGQLQCLGSKVGKEGSAFALVTPHQKMADGTYGK